VWRCSYLEDVVNLLSFRHGPLGDRAFHGSKPSTDLRERATIFLHFILCYCSGRSIVTEHTSNVIKSSITIVRYNSDKRQDVKPDEVKKLKEIEMKRAADALESRKS